MLDVGCGTGEHALLAAGLGLEATGVDLADNALEIARRKAGERQLTARFVRHDALRLAELNESFDTVLDCGLFHLFDGDDRAAYISGVWSVLRPGGRYFMLGFSDSQPGDGGPHRLTRGEITAAFGNGWRVDSLEPATIEITLGPRRHPRLAGRHYQTANPRAGNAMTMLSVQARIKTDSARRYIAQLCRHATAMVGDGGHRFGRHAAVTDEVDVSVESSESEGVIDFGSWGRCTVRAEPGALTARIDGIDAEKLARIRDIIGRNLDRYARREGTTVDWQRIDSTDVPDAPLRRAHHRRLAVVAIPAAVAILAVAMHLVLGAAALTSRDWTRGAIGVVLLIVIVKAGFVFGGFALRRKRSHPSR